MKLADWLKANNVKRFRFAETIGRSPTLVTQLCQEPPIWPGRETAERIREATAGQVTPNDFLPEQSDATG